MDEQPGLESRTIKFSGPTSRRHGLNLLKQVAYDWADYNLSDPADTNRGENPLLLRDRRIAVS